MGVFMPAWILYKDKGKEEQNMKFLDVRIYSQPFIGFFPVNHVSYH